MSERGSPWWRRRWVTVGEVVAIAALAIAALGYWDAHRERHSAQAEKLTAARQEARREALVLTASPRDDGARLMLSPLRAGQAVQSQRYLFPGDVLGHAMEVSAAQPQIDRAWFADGLKGALQRAASTRGEPFKDGEARSDASLYRLGFRLAPGGLFGGRKLVLQGVSLVRHGLGGGAQAAVDAAWLATAARPLAANAG